MGLCVKIIFFCLFLFLSNNALSVVGGQPSYNNDFVVSLDSGRGKKCTAAFISKKVALSAAHCFLNSMDMTNLAYDLNYEYGQNLSKENLDKLIQEYLDELVSSQMSLYYGGKLVTAKASATISKEYFRYMKLILLRELSLASDADLKELEGLWFNVRDTAQINFDQDIVNSYIPVISHEEYKRLEKESLSAREFLPYYQNLDNPVFKLQHLFKFVGHGKRGPILYDEDDFETEQEYEASGVEFNYNRNREQMSLELESGVEFQKEGFFFWGEKDFAACSGDSGGPLYIQLEDGQWRYFATLSKGNSYCGQYLFADYKQFQTNQFFSYLRF